MKNRKSTRAQAAQIDKIARKLGINWATATDEEIDKIARHFAVDQATARAVELGVLEVIGRREDGELIYRRTDVVGDQSDPLFDFDAPVKPKH